MSSSKETVRFGERMATRNLGRGIITKRSKVTLEQAASGKTSKPEIMREYGPQPRASEVSASNSDVPG